jgi:hypothetical protein
MATASKAAVYLSIRLLIAENRTAQALSDLFGTPLICPPSIVAWVGKKAQELGSTRDGFAAATGSPMNA